MCPNPCSYNCGDLPTHQKIQCDAWKKGGISAIGVLECDHSITDFSDLGQLQAAVAADKLHWIEAIKAIYPDAAPVEGENPLACGSETTLDGFNNTITFKDFNVLDENDTFFENLNGRSTMLIWFECKNDIIRVVSEAVSWNVKPAEVPEAHTEKQKYNGTVTWFAEKNSFPVAWAAPAGLF